MFVADFIDQLPYNEATRQLFEVLFTSKSKISVKAISKFLENELEDSKTDFLLNYSDHIVLYLSEILEHNCYVDLFDCLDEIIQKGSLTAESSTHLIRSIKLILDSEIQNLNSDSDSTLLI